MTIENWPYQLYKLSTSQSRADLVRLMYQAGLLTDEELWKACSTSIGPLDATDAKAVYVALGFEPFAGFPLKRIEGPLGWRTTEDVPTAFDLAYPTQEVLAEQKARIADALETTAGDIKSE